LIGGLRASSATSHFACDWLTRTAKRLKYAIRNKTKVLAFNQSAEIYCLEFHMRRVALIVDDDLLVLQTIADMLAELGCEVITRRNATEALATFEQDQRISARLLAGLL